MGLTSHPYPHPLPVLGLRTEVFRISAHPSSIFPPLRKPILEICLSHCFWTGVSQWWAGAQGLLSPTTLLDSGLASSEPPRQLMRFLDPNLRGLDVVAQMRSANQHIFAFQKVVERISSASWATWDSQCWTRESPGGTRLSPLPYLLLHWAHCAVFSWFLEAMAFSLGKATWECVHVPAYVCVCVCETYRFSNWHPLCILSPERQGPWPCSPKSPQHGEWHLGMWEGLAKFWEISKQIRNGYWVGT